MFEPNRHSKPTQIKSLVTTYQNFSKNYVCPKLKWKQTGLTCILRQLVAYFDIENLGRMIGRSATH